MLPDRLLSYDRTDDGRLLPRWLGARDEAWLRELEAEIGAAAGRPLADVDARSLPVKLRDGIARIFAPYL